MNVNPFSPVAELLTGSTEFTKEQLAIVEQAFHVKFLEKKEYLLQPGAKADALWFVSSGCVRAFEIEDGKEIIAQFAIEGSCVSDLNAFLERKPSQLFIQAIEPSVLLQINRDSLNRLFDEIPPLERFFRIKFQNAHNALREHHLHSINHSARERYEKFRTQYKDLEQRIPQYMIASYLGITKEFLSNIRKAH